jgi:DNA-directed RNA polymerase subunit beta'
MFINQTINKNLLEKLILSTFTLFGYIYSSKLLDSLKLLGFYYATVSGLSISLNDLKILNSKQTFLKSAKNKVSFLLKKWKMGKLSNFELYQNSLTIWAKLSES